jgi:hypothetical protein
LTAEKDNDGPDPTKTTPIVQSFKYDKTAHGAKKPSGTEYITESEQTVSTNVNDDGKNVTTMPKVTGEQLFKELYYKKEELK